MTTGPERIWVLNLFPTPKENGGGGLAEYFSFDEKKGERTWPKSKSGFPLMAYRCQLTNYDGSTMFGVQIGLHLIFQEALKTENGFTSGKVFLEREWPILITKIDPGVGNRFVFWIFNMSQYFAAVSFPQIATGKQLDSDEAKSIKIIQPGSGLELVPWEPQLDIF
jgi:hypothetical protein